MDLSLQDGTAEYGVYMEADQTSPLPMMTLSAENVGFSMWASPKQYVESSMSGKVHYSPGIS